MNNLTSVRTFENIKQFGQKGRELWYARDLADALGYESFEQLFAELRVAVDECEAGGVDARNNIIKIKREKQVADTMSKVEDFVLSRLACYLIVKNHDPLNEVSNLANSYFAVMSRKQELTKEKFDALEAKKRLMLRPEVVKSNKRLVSAAVRAWGLGSSKELDRLIQELVVDEKIKSQYKFKYNEFHNAGYKGLYEGWREDDLHKAMGLVGKQEVLDHMCSAGLAANMLKAQRTTARLRKIDKPMRDGQEVVNGIHESVGTYVRKLITRVGGTEPRFMPVMEDACTSE